MTYKFNKTNIAKCCEWLKAQLYRLQDDKDYIIELKEYKHKRSLNANAYAWILIDKLAAYHGLTPEYVYKSACEDIGGNSFIISVSNSAADTLVRTWECKGIGWQAVKLGEREGEAEYRLIYGSSVYDTAQMSRLINLLVSECVQVGIETMTEKEIESL